MKLNNTIPINNKNSIIINKYYKIEKKYFNFINLNLIQILKK